MTFLIIVAGALFGTYFLLNWFAKVNAKALSKALKGLFLFALGGIALFLILTGKAIQGLGLCILIFSFFFRWTVLHKKEDQDLKEDFKNSSTDYSFDHPMTSEEALEILGLKENATRPEILAAYKKLMAHVHPDHGGSTYLAQQINEAKDVLLKKL